MSAKAEMSRAIRLVLEKHGARIQDLDTDTLRQLVEIVGAFYADLRGELHTRADA